MESFNHASHFTYNSGRSTLDDDPEQDDRVFSGILEIFVHNARNIHNICIYEEQDVYAKFSLTYNPDETVSTKIVKRGGKNPDFNEELVLNVTQLDAVLKCEVWMFSRMRHLMEDQLLGFALVPISMVAAAAAASGNGRFVEEEFSLSSTDLFHSPAGTVKLRLKLSLDTSAPFGISCSKASGIASISSEVVLLDRKGLERGAVPDRDEYSRIEFPDINVARENHQMVSEYFNLASGQSGSSANSRVGRGSFSFLHLGGARKGLEDHEMSTVNSSSDESSISPPATSGSGGVLETGVLSYSSTASTCDDRSSTVGSMEKIKISSNTDGSGVVPAAAEDVNDNDHLSSGTAASMNATPRSNQGAEVKDGEQHRSKLQQEEKEESVTNDKTGIRSSAQFSHQVFAAAPLMNINLEAEQSAAMQQQIVDMYMKSMQQFTESLSKMKIPIDLDRKKDGEQERMTKAVLDQGPSNDRLLGTDQSDKKDGSRVFYGSRAFF